MRVGVIDYGTGNLGSVMRALEKLRVTPVLVDRPEEIKNADGLILPGVGNFTDYNKAKEIEKLLIDLKYDTWFTNIK